VTTDAGPIYLDYAATTPVDPAVAQAMIACLGPDGDFGNSGSATHRFGRRAAARVDQARAADASLLSAQPDEIIFTSGATESNNLAVLGIARANGDRGRHIITSRTEHKAVLDPCKRLEKEGFSVTYLTPDRSGWIDPEAVRAAIRPDTILVSIMFANNEIGVLQDIRPGHFQKALAVPGIIMMNRNIRFIITGVIDLKSATIRAPTGSPIPVDLGILRPVIKNTVITGLLVIPSQPNAQRTPSPFL